MVGGVGGVPEIEGEGGVVGEGESGGDGGAGGIGEAEEGRVGVDYYGEFGADAGVVGGEEAGFRGKWEGRATGGDVDADVEEVDFEVGAVANFAVDGGLA